MKATRCSPKRILSLEVRQDLWYHFVSSDARFYSRHPLCCFFWTVHLLSESLSRRFKIQPPTHPNPLSWIITAGLRIIWGLCLPHLRPFIFQRARLWDIGHIILSLYCLRVFTEWNTFCLGKCSCSTVCLGQKKDRGWKTATTECSSLLKWQKKEAGCCSCALRVYQN